MRKIIYLKLDTDKGVITIPFKNIESVDQFTVVYDYMGQLISSMIRMLNLPLSLYDVSSVYLTYDKYNRGFDINSCFPIKYSCDNFSFESLKEAFAKYLKNDLKRIFSTDVKFIKCREVSKYYDTGFIEDYEIERIVRAFFTEKAGYKRRRDMYFLIKSVDENINIKIESLDLQGIGRENQEDLSIYSREEDDYLSYLIELSKKSPEAFEYARDQIGQSDLEEVSKLLRNNGYGIVDGVSNCSKLMEKEIKLLEVTTGISIDELRRSHTYFGRKRKR